MSSPTLMQTIVDSGCVSTLRKVFEIEQRIIGALSIGELYDYFALKASMHIPELAVFQWCRRVGVRGCTSYKRHPELCRSMSCQMHLSCAVCESREHDAIEVYSGVAITRCPVVRKLDDELQMLRNCWNVSGVELYHFFANLSRAT